MNDSDFTIDSGDFRRDTERRLTRLESTVALLQPTEAGHATAAVKLRQELAVTKVTLSETISARDVQFQLRMRAENAIDAARARVAVLEGLLREVDDDANAYNNHHAGLPPDEYRELLRRIHAALAAGKE